jgi:Flp pilus assembly protein TadB
VTPTRPGRPSPRLGLLLVAVAVALFLVQIVALALGWIEIALACAGLFVVAWFVLRARMRT